MAAGAAATLSQGALQLAERFDPVVLTSELRARKLLRDEALSVEDRSIVILGFLGAAAARFVPLLLDKLIPGPTCLASIDENEEAWSDE